jgi:ubiquinone biosynthesis protein
VLAVTNRILYRHKISVPPTFLFFFKAISTLEGVARRLDPEFDWRQDWGPKLEKLFRSRYSPEALVDKYWKALKDYDRLIVDYPEDFRDVIKKVTEGKFEIEMHMPELSGYVAEIRTALHKLSVAVVVAAIIFGLFFLGRGQDFKFLQWLLDNWYKLWWVILILILVILYLRKPLKKGE